MIGTRVDFKKNNIYHGNGTIEEDVMAFVTRSVINPDDGKWKWAMNEQVFDTVCEFKKEFLSTQIWDDGARENIRAVFGVIFARYVQIVTKCAGNMIKARFDIFMSKFAFFLIKHLAFPAL